MKTLDVLQDIISYSLEIPKERVFAYNNDLDLPKDSGVFVVMSFMSRIPYSNNIEYQGTVEDLKEIQTMNVAEDILISIASRNIDAREKAHEIFMAFNNTYAIYMQEKNKMAISTTGDIMDSSFLEETARLNRFDIKCRVLRGYDKVRSIDFYDKFPRTSKFEPEWHYDK